MKTLLWLDDCRNPLETNKEGLKHWLVFSPIEQPFDVVWVKSYKEFVNYIETKGLPDAICFDHDLADISYNPNKGQTMFVYHDKTGYDCAKWLVEYCLDNDLKLPPYNIQSANPVGKANIDGILKSYNKFKNFEI